MGCVDLKVMCREPSMIYKFCTKTDSGRARENNEDAVAFDEATGLAVLADGMGGYNAGEVASGMATELIMSEMKRWLSEVGSRVNVRDIRRAIEICVDNANRSIFNAAAGNPQYAGMGTTLVVGVFHDARLLVGHIGDSRCYRLRAGELSQITKDHSLLQEQIDAGLITPQQAATSANKNLVTRALGVEDEAMLELNEYAVESDDLYLMCSDGLSDMVPDEGIATILRTTDTLTQKADQLVALANANGGRDNITVLLVQVGVTVEKRGLIARWLGN
jgi:serine/threonine protein phosphatase PrpC